VLAEEPARLEPSLDLTRRHAGIEELRPGDHPVPGAANSCHHLFDRPAFTTHTVV
jgi:hypothetical protein